MQTLRYALCFLSFSFLSLLAQEQIPDATLAIPMRDGTELLTDIYLPKDAFTTAPACILMRSPAGRKSATALMYTYLTKYGFSLAIQETRSFMDAQGKTLPYWNDGWGNHQDGFDTIEWLAKSPYSNGYIGTLGASAMGNTQLLLAPTKPPALKCQYIGMAFSSLYHDAVFTGGQLQKNQVEGWLSLFAKDAGIRNFICTQPNYNNFWANFDTAKVADRVTVPALFYTGWFDTALQGTINAYAARQDHGGEGAKGKQKLIIGPWTHFWPKSQKIGAFDIPKQGQQAPINITPERWFGHYLNDEDNGVENIPNVTYYVMGPFDNTSSSGNVWRYSDRWPVPSTETPLYLSPERDLSFSEATENQCIFSYDFDPKNPVPTLGGRNLFIESGVKDQTPIEQRKDVIVFTLAPLKQDLEVTGNVVVKLFFSSDRPETDVVVRLMDVYPDGRSFLIMDGLTHFKNDKMNAHQEVEVDLGSTSIVFANGHSIRISVSSSNYPKFDTCKDAEEDGRGAIARNALYVGGKTASHVLLPVVGKK